MFILTLAWTALALAASPGVTYTITTVAGGAACGDGGPATSAQLASPDGLAVDAAGNVYVADSQDHRVRKITPAGVITTVAGDGYRGFRGDGGPAASARLDSPYGLAVDRAGNLYIADLGNSRVRKVTPDGFIQTVAGSGRAPDGSATADSGDALAADLRQPRNVAVDADGNLYVSDFGAHRVYKVTAAGLITRIAGVGVPASMKDEPAQALYAPLNSPAGLAVDASGTVYVADTGNSKVRRIRDGVMTTVASVGRILHLPVGLALDSAGALHVADKGARTIVKLGAVATAVAGPFAQPRDIAFDRTGSLYIADSEPQDRYAIGSVRKMGADGSVHWFAGDRTYRPLGDGRQATLAHLESPTGLALDRGGNLYIADRLHHRVRKVAGGIISTVAGTGVAGHSSDGTLATAAQLEEPAGLAVDSRQSLWVAEAGGHRIRNISAAGITARAAGLAGRQPGYSGDGAAALLARLNSPAAIAFGASGRVYIADAANHVVRAIGADGVISTFAGKGVPGYGGDAGPATQALLNSPTGLAVDSSGNVYIADAGNHAVRTVSPAGTISTLAGPEARLDSPAAVALDAAGLLYIADTGNQRILRLAADGTIETIAGTGIRGHGAGDGPALEAELMDPAALAVDAAGVVYVAERRGNRVRKLTPSHAVFESAAFEVRAAVNAASALAGPVAPGEIITLYGSGLGPGIGVEAAADASGKLPTYLGETLVLFDGVPAPLLYVQYGLINLQVPYETAGRKNSEVEIRRGNSTPLRMLVPIAPAAPGIFTTGPGVGQAAASNEDGSPNSASNPVSRGMIVTLWATGAGLLDPFVATGAPPGPPHSNIALPVTVTIGGEQAVLYYAGAAPGLAGLVAINARVPASIGDGDQPVLLTVGGISSRPGVTIAVR